jgi:hypothetical protein
MVSVGAGIALDAIGASPMLQNLISGLLNCAVNNLGPDTSSIGASLFKQIGDNISKFGHKLIDLAGNVVSFAAKVMQGVGYLTKAGFAKAVDFFSSMFDHKTIEDLTQNGTVSIESALSDHCSTIIDGIHCAYKTVQIDYSVSNDSFSYSNTGVAGEFQALRTDQTSFEGNISISEDLPDGIKLDERFVGGQAVNVNVVDPQKLQFRIVRLNPGEEILPVTMTNEGLFYNVPIRGTNHYFSFTGNGFWNDGIPDKTGIAALSKQFIQDTIQDKLSAGEVPIPLLDSSGRPAVDREGYILTANSLPLTLYDDTANVAINAIVWGKEFLGGHPLSGRLEQELRSYFNLIEYNKQHYGLQADQLQYTYFAHSGNFMPLLKVLDSNPDMPIQTIISYEGPDLLDRTIHNSHLERIIQVKGTQGNLDYDLSGLAVSGMTGGAEVKDFGPPFLDFRDYRGIDASGTVRDIQNIHIEILGARHNDFDYHPDDPDPVFREISRKTNLFMRDLSLISNSNSQLKDFLEITPGISFDSNRKVYVVDPGKYESFRERN